MQGLLTYVNTHEEIVWTLVQANDTTVYTLASGQPVDESLENVAAGSTISLVCTPSTTEFNTCIATSTARITLSAAPVRSTGIRIRMLVLNMRLTGGCNYGGLSSNEVTNLFLRQGGHADQMNACSYGSMQFDRSGFRVLNTPVPCLNSIRYQCDWSVILEQSLASARQLIGSDAMAFYTHTAIVLPKIDPYPCRWAGLALIPSTITFYQPAGYGVYRTATVMQEIIHNYQLIHGWRNGKEYDDYSTCRNMQPGQFITFVLPATYTAASRNMLKIQPNWMGFYYRRNVYLALRQRGGGDKLLAAEFTNKINIHDVEKNIDNSFTAGGDPRISFNRAVGANGATVLDEFRLVVHTGGFTTGGTKMVVKVCRFLLSSSECVDTIPVTGKARPALRVVSVLTANGTLASDDPTKTPAITKLRRLPDSGPHLALIGRLPVLIEQPAVVLANRAHPAALQRLVVVHKLQAAATSQGARVAVAPYLARHHHHGRPTQALQEHLRAPALCYPTPPHTPPAPELRPPCRY
ncbi:hypothetical protein TSOC_002954 [Tetrabaena socialis]|uniref:Peptidase M11 gametolysin domain-containing protein n=1 Tax=Tetrabaena socialis TaxID=47790 RepID=A0A2J8ACS9_9CHLO|nr:hypothetical protein TSOC_002954 [Tetrabaena socialis]|eukprot:PNH10319.1 hypothetical protein TSOC_002954 [Tetrabaena socialis]